MKTIITLSILLTSCAVIFASEVKSRHFALEQSERESALALFVENDFRFSDRYYTNGLKLTYTDPSDDWYASFLQFKLLRLLPISGKAQASQTASIGQDMYVGYDISIPNPPLSDRPYAGWLYVASGAHLATQNSLDSLTVNIGIVGPQSYAGDTQRAYHDIIGVDQPMGWHNQIKNEPGIVIAYNHSERLFRARVTQNMQFDFIGSLGGNLGNVSTEGRVKALARFGFNLPYNFDMTRIDFTGSQNVEWIEANHPDWHLYVYFGGIARFVGYDITLDGNTFANSRSVDKKWFVGETNLGISARYKMIEVDLNWIVRSEEFNTQIGGAHIFWCASIGGRF